MSSYGCANSHRYTIRALICVTQKSQGQHTKVLSLAVLEVGDMGQTLCLSWALFVVHLFHLLQLSLRSPLQQTAKPHVLLSSGVADDVNEARSTNCPLGLNGSRLYQDST